MAKKPVLGRGLGALITVDDVKVEGGSSINEVELSKIAANPAQPRTIFDEESLDELAASISQIGVIQPITLRELEDGTYQIIAGERRFRASKKAGLRAVPAYVRKASDEAVMEMALIENIQREDLNSIEIALAYQNLIESNDLTQEQLSKRIGKNRATIANYLRLLKLPAGIQMGIRDKKLDMAHARTIVALDDPTVQLDLYELILKEGLPVRKVEEYVKALKEGAELADLIKNETSGATSRPKSKKTKQSTNDAFSMLTDHLSKYFQTKIQLTCNDKGKGKLTIPFASEEELERIIQLFDQIKK